MAESTALGPVSETMATTRGGLFKSAFLRPWVKVMLALYGWIGGMDFLADKFGWIWWHDLSRIPSFTWTTWVIGGLVLCLVILFEGAFRLVRLVESTAQGTTNRLRDQVTALESRPGVTARDWSDLREQFRSVPEQHVRGEWYGDAHTERWLAIRGASPTSNATAQSLCELAGSMLLRSRPIARTLSAAVVAQPTAWARWLEYVKETGPDRFRLDLTGHELINGERVQTRGGRLDNVPVVSADACAECAAKEWG